MKKLSILIALSLMFVASSADAVSSYMSSFNSRYGTSSTRLNTCLICHNAGPTGNRLNSRNSYGSDWDSAGGNTQAYSAIEPIDSDLDGFINLAEINARTFPGNAMDFPVIVPPKQLKAPDNVRVNRLNK